MKITFIHYHLKTGGVTTVLRQQIDAIGQSCEVLVLTGERPDPDFPARVVHIPGLRYTDGVREAIEPEKVAETICQAILSRWNNGCDLIHVHNPTIAKNVNFLKVLNALKKRGQKLFLQIHDFAEDGRPTAYFKEEYITDCHYGAINSRDYNILLKAGLKKEGLHKIPNTINSLSVISNIEQKQNRILYPVRAIRRKNVGEAILLSLFFKKGETLSITQPPNSPADIREYERWKTFVKKNRLSVKFDEGLVHDFHALVRSSRFIVTTSITEGFGFSFLEPWTAGKLLWGRKLPDICHDFEQKGIRLDHLYTRLKIPVDMIGSGRLFEAWKKCVKKTCDLFHVSIEEDELKNGFYKTIQDETIDFGLLGETFQRTVIKQVLTNRPWFKKLIELNPFLAFPGDVSGKHALIAHNRKIIENTYTTTRYRNTLLDIYEKVVKIPVRHRIDKRLLLGMFLDLERFSLLKWCDDSR